MRKKIVLVFAVAALIALMLVTPVYATGDDNVVVSTENNGVTVSKTVLYSGISDPLSGLQKNTKYTWYLEISVYTTKDVTNVRLSDRFGAEFSVLMTAYNTGPAPMLSTKGNSEKVFLDWNVGSLTAGQTATVSLTVSTDLNPAGKQEFTSCGTYYLNSGATAKWLDNGVQFSASTPQIMISVG
jgi:hypothetical protein